MKQFMEELGQWLRHKIRVIIMKQWKTPKTIYRNLSYLNRKNKNGFNQEAIFKVANSRLGWYRRSGFSMGGARKFILPLPYYVVFNYTGRAGSVAISKFFVNTAAVNLQSAGFDGNMKVGKRSVL